MNRKRNHSILCFSVNKNDNPNFETSTNHSKSPMSRSFIEPSSNHELSYSNNNNRPLPPPYDECTSKAHSGTTNMKRSFSSYSASQERHFHNNMNPLSAHQQHGLIHYLPRGSIDDTFSQFSENDPPRLIDEKDIKPLSNNYIRPKSLRPTSPPQQHVAIDTAVSVASNFRLYRQSSNEESPGGDSGFGMTPNDLGEIQRLYIQSGNSKLDPRQEESHFLKVNKDKVNNYKEMVNNNNNNQNLVNRASFFIERLRNKLNEKSQEILVLQKTVNERTEKLKMKEMECHQLDIELTKSQQHLQKLANRKSLSTATVKDVACQTNPLSPTNNSKTANIIPNSIISNNDNSNIESEQSLLVRFEQERAKWLEEKANVLCYHKQLSVRYQALLEKNKQLETELLDLHQRLIFDYNDTNSAHTQNDRVDDEDDTVDADYNNYNDDTNTLKNIDYNNMNEYYDDRAPIYAEYNNNTEQHGVDPSNKSIQYQQGSIAVNNSNPNNHNHHDNATNNPSNNKRLVKLEESLC